MSIAERQCLEFNLFEYPWLEEYFPSFFLTGEVYEILPRIPAAYHHGEEVVASIEEGNVLTVIKYACLMVATHLRLYRPFRQQLVLSDCQLSLTQQFCHGEAFVIEVMASDSRPGDVGVQFSVTIRKDDLVVIRGKLIFAIERK